MSSQPSQLKFTTFERELLNPLKGHKLTELEEYVASFLLTASSHQPIRIEEIIIAVGNATAEFPSDRQVKDVVRTLRKEHGFPILSRKSRPAGYWWCGSKTEMEEYIGRALSQPLDELHTLSKMVKQNFPELAGQLSFEDVSFQKGVMSHD